MPRQNFLTRESFVDASEARAKDGLLSIPSFAPAIRWVQENKMIESHRFACEGLTAPGLYHIDVSVHQVNDCYTRISFHGARADGQLIEERDQLSLILHDFEIALLAALSGETAYYQPFHSRPKPAKKLWRSAATFAASFAVLWMKK